MGTKKTKTFKTRIQKDISETILPKKGGGESSIDPSSWETVTKKLVTETMLKRSTKMSKNTQPGKNRVNVGCQLLYKNKKQKKETNAEKKTKFGVL
jgi:hypothetical protein